MDENNNNNANKRNTDSSVLSAIKIAVVEWFLSSTAHALPNIFRTNNLLIKVMWLVCFLASTAYCIRSMVISLQEFLEYPSYISTSYVQEIPTKFPAISFCNLKFLNALASKSVFSQPKFLGYLTPPSVFPTALSYLTGQAYLFRSAVSNDDIFNASMRLSIGYQLKDMLISCSYNYKLCNESDFYYFYHPQYGNCYTFNKGVDQAGNTVEIKTGAVTGPLYGLILELFSGEPVVETKLEPNDGFIVSIHNQSSMPFTEDSPLVIPTGADTHVRMDRNFMTKLEYPYSGNCLKDTSANSNFNSFYFEYIVKTLQLTYSQSYCFSLCRQKQLMNRCNCSNTWLPPFKGYTNYCSSGNILCLLDFMSGYGENQAGIDECKTGCPFECDSIDYSTTTLRSFYPTEFYKTFLFSRSTIIKNSNITVDNLGKALAKINIYYKNMLYTRTEENVQTSTEEFFSNIGGTLGLYIGISLLSLVELVEIGIQCVLLLASNIKRENKVVTQVEMK